MPNRCLCRCFSITVRQHPRLRNLIEAIPETDWTPIPYWMDGAASLPRPFTLPSTVNPTPHQCASSQNSPDRNLLRSLHHRRRPPAQGLQLSTLRDGSSPSPDGFIEALALGTVRPRSGHCACRKDAAFGSACPEIKRNRIKPFVA